MPWCRLPPLRGAPQLSASARGDTPATGSGSAVGAALITRCAFGQQIDPCNETIRAEFFENDGSGGRRTLGEFTLEPDDLLTCVERPPASGDERYKMVDQTEMSSDPPGVQKATIQEKGNKVKFKLKGRTQASILKPINATIRFCLHIGDDAGGAVLTCEERLNGDLLKCESTN